MATSKPRGRFDTGPGSTLAKALAKTKPRRPRLTEQRKREMLLVHDAAINQHQDRLHALEQRTRSWWRKIFD